MVAGLGAPFQIVSMTHPFLLVIDVLRILAWRRCNIKISK